MPWFLNTYIIDTTQDNDCMQRSEHFTSITKIEKNDNF